MDSFFGIGAPELVLILILAGVVMGPERIGYAARWLGRVTAQLQSISRGFMRQLNTELDAIDSGEFKSAMQEVRDLQRQMADLRGELKATAASTLQEGQAILAEGKEEVERAVRPNATD